MNERILEIAKQAGLKFPSETALSPQEKKFAELIVKECASKVDWILAGGGRTQGDLIKQHFGVQE